MHVYSEYVLAESSISMIQLHDPKKVGEVRLSGNSPSQRKVKVRAQGKNLEAKAVEETMKCCLLACLLTTISAYFLIEPSTICPGVAQTMN